MSETSAAAIDLASAHRHFSAQCFNQAWDLLEKTDRTAEDDEQMELLAIASLWHWTQRADCTPQNRSIGHWQVSRIYAVLGQAENARSHAEACLRHTTQDAALYRGYAHEALARAAQLGGFAEEAAEHLARARAAAADVTDPVERQMLERDLDTLG